MRNFNLTVDDLDAIIIGYDSPDPAFRCAIDLHTVGLAVGHLAHHARIGDTSTIHEGAAALRAPCADSESF